MGHCYLLSSIEKIKFNVRISLKVCSSPSLKEKKIATLVEKLLQFSTLEFSLGDSQNQTLRYLAEVKVVLKRGQGIFHDVRKGIVSAVVDDLELLLLALLEQQAGDRYEDPPDAQIEAVELHGRVSEPGQEDPAVGGRSFGQKRCASVNETQKLDKRIFSLDIRILNSNYV